MLDATLDHPQTHSREKIEFIDLPAQRRALGAGLEVALARVLSHGHYIFGPEVTELEKQLADFAGTQDAITCSNGTDALRLLLIAYGIGPGDAVFVPNFTFASTAEVVAQANATPVFVDICPKTYNIDPSSLEQAITQIDRKKLNPKAIIAVDLFGLPANYPVLNDIAQHHHLWLIADAAQSFGGGIAGKKVGNLAPCTTTSFFPSKPLACYGDGGAIFSNDPQMSTLLRSLRNHGCGVHRYDHIHIGLNSRLDTLQAAILIEKLKLFPNEIRARNKIARFYHEALSPLEGITVPTVPAHYDHAWGLYTITCEASKRNHLIQALQEKEIPTNIYYRKPLHLQPAYAHFPRASETLIQAERLSQQVLSLPMHPYLKDNQLEYIVECLKQALK